MERLTASELQKQALWLFGVLVGVAIKEAISSFHADLFSGSDLWIRLLATARFVLFLGVSLRFYLGAVQYFNAVYGTSAVNNKLPRWFGKDLVFGLFHLVMVCLCGLSLAQSERRWPFFPALLMVVLMCDVLWYISSARDTRKAIRVRALVNTVSAAFATIAFGTTALAFMCVANGWRVELTQAQGAICEVVAYVPVLVAIAVELGRLVYGRGVEEWLGEALSRPEAHQR